MFRQKSEELYRRYPKIFAQKFRGEHGGFWGFECRDGWFDLIDRLCAKIKAEGSPIEAAQVKEKFGGLRFYYDWIAEENDRESVNELDLVMKIRGLVHQAEEESFTICEVCGEPGELRHLRWIQTLCDRHTEEYNAKIENK